MAIPDNQQNLRSEKKGFAYLLGELNGLYKPTTIEKKELLKKFDFPARYIRSFDLIQIKVNSFNEIKILDDVVFFEVKVTAKYLPNFPEGFFFGMTQNEDQLLQSYEGVFKICLVSINEKKCNYIILTHSELQKLIKVKRVQYQINL